MGSYDVIEGALATLRRAQPSAKLAELFKQRPTLRARVGLERVPDLERLKVFMVEDEILWIWEIYPAGKTQPVGLAGFVLYDGPPYIWMYEFDEPKFSPELGQDIFMTLGPLFFKTTEEPALFYFNARPVPEVVHEMLVQGGFDPVDDLPTIDNSEEAGYVLERHTFEAYYGDGGETDQLGEDEEGDAGGEVDDEA